MQRQWLLLFFVLSQPLSAKTIRLETVTNADVGSACYFSDPQSKKQVLITSYTSNGKNTAYIKIDGKQYSLGMSAESTPRLTIYQSTGIRLELGDWREIAPFCKGTECEGAFYRVFLTIRKGRDNSRIKIHAHCGA
ncbi:MAG: hypothetical protein ABI644_06225 [Arenimonas sp.]